MRALKAEAKFGHVLATELSELLGLRGDTEPPSVVPPPRVVPEAGRPSVVPLMTVLAKLANWSVSLFRPTPFACFAPFGAWGPKRRCSPVPKDVSPSGFDDNFASNEINFAV